MKPQTTKCLIFILLAFSVIACSGKKSKAGQTTNIDSVYKQESVSGIQGNPSSGINIDPKGKTERNENGVKSGDTSHYISSEEILKILSSGNKDVIDSLKLSDSESTSWIDDERYYVPVFRYEKSGIYIGFNGETFDSIHILRERDETPLFISPFKGTIISFDEDLNFMIGDDIKKFKAKSGEGIPGKEGNLQGDREYSFLNFNKGGITIRFTSLNGDDFKDYSVYITKQ